MNDKTRNAGPDVRSLISKLSKAGQQLLEREIIAPLLPGGRIRTRLDGLVYEFKVQERFAGWGCFRPINEREAALVREAQPWERGAYLEQFPLLRVILLWPDLNRKRPGAWWALPFNESDARQRFSFNSGPLPIFLCDPTNGAQAFERVLARVDDATLWFDGLDTLADPTHAEWLRDTATTIENLENFLPGLAASERLALLFWQIRQIELAAQATQTPQQTREQASQAHPRGQTRQQQRDWLRQEARRGPLERRLRHALEKADATLLSFSEIPAADGSPGHLVIEWSERGQQQEQRHRYRSIIDPRFGVVSSGICLSGRDRDFDLTSLVSVMTNAPWQEEEYP